VELDNSKNISFCEMMARAVTIWGHGLDKKANINVLCCFSEMTGKIDLFQVILHCMKYFSLMGLLWK